MTPTTYIRTFPERIRYVWCCGYSAWRRFSYLVAGRSPDEVEF